MNDERHDAAPRPPRAEVDALLRAEDWRVTTKRLVGYAYSRTRDTAQARDLAQSAIVRAFDADHHVGWNPNARPLMQHLMGEVNTLLASDRKHRRQHREIAASLHKKATGDERQADKLAAKARLDEPAADERLASHEERANKLAALRAWFGERGDREALDVVDAFEREIEDAQQIAAACGLPVEQAARARRRVMRRVRAMEMREGGERDDAPPSQETP